MNTTEKTEIDLGGRKFLISCLPFAKNRVIVPAADFAWKAYKRSNPPEKGGSNEPLTVTAVDNTYLAVFTAVNHADPSVTRDVFDNFKLDMTEMIIALGAICIQTGVLTRAKSEETITGEKPAGEQ